MDASSLVMCILGKIALCLLCWPILALAQDPQTAGQAEALPQSPTGTGPSTPAPDTLVAPSPPAPFLPSASVRPPLNLSEIRQPPIAPLSAPRFNLSAGYSVTGFVPPSSGRIILNGIDVSLAGDSGKRIGAKLDVAYAGASNAYGTGQRVDMLTYMLGPVFSLWNRTSLDTYAHVLAGGARVGGPFPTPSGLRIGHVYYPAWGAGGGVEYRLSPAFGLRVTIDYLHTHFYNSSLAIRGQNELRVVNSIVYYFGRPSFRSR
jgi:hypothetical protein